MGFFQFAFTLIKSYIYYMEMDKTVFEVVDINDIQRDKEYWLSITPEERLEVLYILRQRVYGEDEIRKGLQRVFSVVELKDL
jgi:hypothetical protein